MEYLEEADRQCFLTAKRILENGQIDPEDKNNIGKTAFDIAVEEGARRIGALLSGQDPETDELSALAGGLNVFQALWYKDMIALDAICDPEQNCKPFARIKSYTISKADHLWPAPFYGTMPKLRKCC